MKLYHGTSIGALKRIKKEGLLPRNKTKVKSNWEYGKGEGKQNLIYLTTCYPAFYANSAEEEENGYGVILEIELPDNYKFYPDEEFLYHAIRNEQGNKIFKMMENIDPFEYQKHWKKSLDYMGTVAVKKVDLKYILGFYIIKDFRNFLKFGDPVISPINYKFCSLEYKKVLANTKFIKLKT